MTFQCSKSIFSFVEVDKPEYFYLYRISYAWYAAIGFFMTVTLGLIASLFAARTFNRCDTAMALTRAVYVCTSTILGMYVIRIRIRLRL